MALPRLCAPVRLGSWFLAVRTPSSTKAFSRLCDRCIACRMCAFAYERAAREYCSRGTAAPPPSRPLAVVPPSSPVAAWLVPPSSPAAVCEERTEQRSSVLGSMDATGAGRSAGVAESCGEDVDAEMFLDGGPRARLAASSSVAPTWRADAIVRFDCASLKPLDAIDGRWAHLQSFTHTSLYIVLETRASPRSALLPHSPSLPIPLVI